MNGYIGIKKQAFYREWFTNLGDIGYYLKINGINSYYW